MAASVNRRHVLALLAAALTAACAGVPGPGEAVVTRLFLVRHSEKQAGPDPDLTPDGTARAEALAARLAGEGVTEIWSTRTQRTEKTAAPLARLTGLQVQFYDGAALPALANALTATPGVKLVVGHSNTTDALAALAGADPGPPIDEATEFDRLYVIEICADGIVRSKLERFGAASPVDAGVDQ